MSIVEVIQLAEYRNQEHYKRLAIIQSKARDIRETVLDNDEAIVADGIIKSEYSDYAHKTLKELNDVIVESRHHTRWLTGLLRETPPGELRDRLLHIITTVAPKTHETLQNIDTINKLFNRLNNYRQN